MLTSILYILLGGFFAGQIARRLGAPPLIGMIIAGIALGPQLGNLLAVEVLEGADNLRIIAVMIILMKAGLGLDRDKLKQQGSVALRLGVLPASCEAIAVAIISMWIFQLDFPTGLLLGCIIGAESPAVIVPGMLRLKSLGWGVAKGIPDAILIGSALSDVLLLLVFGLLVNFLSQGELDLSSVGLLPLQVILEIGLGLLVGYLAARLTVLILTKQNWTQNSVQDILIGANIALLLVVGEKVLAYSGYLAAMGMGFFLIELDTPLARNLRNGFDSLWIVAEIVLFVLLGASIKLEVLGNIFLPGLLLLSIGLLVGRGLGWYLSTVGSNWNWRERLFLLPANSAKATVQAAIGGIPLARGIEGGEVILAIAVLSILITAPLGAWSTIIFAPKLLTKGEVDPTKVSIINRISYLAVVDTSAFAKEVLKVVGEKARSNNAQVIVLHVINETDTEGVKQLREISKQLLADIRYQFLTKIGTIPEEIIQTAEDYQVTEIIMGKRGYQPWKRVLIGSVSQAVLENSLIPVTIVEYRDVSYGDPRRF
ncbi:MAG: sodium:proton antiporter [Gloeocapsa sp. DLM2.Bin57]|nr:MAG: sodium:proton antiporter [Gloeocapsa sp. DLM2.Bin57]